MDSEGGAGFGEVDSKEAYGKKRIHRLHGVPCGWIKAFMLACGDRVNALRKDDNHDGASLRSY